MHLPATTGAHQAVGFDYLLDAWQTGGQVAAVAPGHSLSLGLVVSGRLHLLLFTGLGDGSFKILEGQLAIIFAELLGLLAVDHLVQLGHQMLKTFDDVLQLRGPRSFCFQGLKSYAVFRWQDGQIEVFGSGAHDQYYTLGSKP